MDDERQSVLHFTVSVFEEDYSTVVQDVSLAEKAFKNRKGISILKKDSLSRYSIYCL